MPAKQPHIYVTWLLFAIIITGYLLFAVKFPLAYIVATYEDLVGEWTQVFLFASTMLLCTRLACQKIAERWWFALLALACFYVVGEEISWGQRIFDIATPDFFQQHNQQNETNLHNFFTGPIKSTSKMLLEYLLAAGITGYGLLYPLLIKLRKQPALWFNGKGLPFPPLYLWPFFVASAIFELGLIQFNESEIAELLLPLALSLMALNYLLTAREKKPLAELSGWDLQRSRKLGRQTLLLFATVILLACGTTAACYNSPRLGPEISERYLNGMEKFAGRYQRLGNWEIASQLYSRVLQQEPERADILRQLFKVETERGDPAQAKKYLQQAQQVDIEYLARNSLSVAAHLSLADTYDLLEKTEDAEDHRLGSLQIAQLNVKRAPNGTTVYWLAKALEANGQQDEALKAYRRSLELQPGSLRALKAIQRLGTEQKND
ncbi:Tetratricopeptide repeat-containing protein [Malonomonas rubra DSM 5091]|uniref:Tetratricopeptide repeat-containing protein n=1 Tax=Malonomonas rubra DSM 5091 TaxID=1122189 RepID=A0A1M6I8L4_MALRU|nr:tetratricopeptide repeat protein [Malonomonas rubra]SHJ30839.1 Tetratricopeptide repeat-containing protein [Malonomonas rubra DSM 5091]